MSPRRTGWAASALVLLTALLLPALPTPTPAAASPVGYCTPSSGVIVAVDFSSWGGNPQRGCDASPTTGYNALHAAGFSTTGTTHDGPAFICRIDNHPTTTQQSCSRTPPAKAYWSYWHANAGQNSWSYSTQGAVSYHPAPGSIDAWAFGAGAAPSFSPAQVRASQPPASTPARSTPAASATPTTARSSGGPASNAGVPGSSPAGGAIGTSSGPAGRASAASSSATGHQSSSAGRTGAANASPSPSSTTSGPRIEDAVPVAQSHAASGSPWPLVLTVVVLAVLGGTAGWTVWQRRRRTG